VPARLTRYAELTSPAAGRLHNGAVALLPVGAVEPHGPHAPLGTDTLISQEVCERAARLLADAAPHTLVLPAIPYGVTDFSSDMPGSVGISAASLSAVVAEVCRAVERQGIAHRFIVNSHFEPAHVAALYRAAEASGALLFDVTRRHLAERLTPEFRSGAAHAGRYETSMVLALRDDLVDRDTMHALPELLVDLPREMRAGKHSFTELGMHDAYCGNPAGSSAAEGAQTLETLAGLLVELVRSTLTA
jgi:creatinine amidohydrolase